MADKLDGVDVEGSTRSREIRTLSWRAESIDFGLLSHLYYLRTIVELSLEANAKEDFKRFHHIDTS